MSTAKLYILGSGSALPTIKNSPAAQILNIRDKNFMIDCGEGAQIRISRMGINISRLNHIFISHLHGDHCFGLIGLISTLGMFKRTSDLHIYAHKDLFKILQVQLDFFCNELSFKVIYHEIDPYNSTCIYEDKSINVYTIPLKHKMPTCGFLFKEKSNGRHIIREMIDFYKIPVKDIPKLKNGEDWIDADGNIIKNERLTTPASSVKSYAYCSDTSYNENIIPIIKGVDCLFHEATFLEEHKARAKETMHTTALGAATIAKKAEVKQLIIGHLSARYKDQKTVLDEAKSVFNQTLLAQDGLIIEF